jgi:hypothetical protein
MAHSLRKGGGICASPYSEWQSTDLRSKRVCTITSEKEKVERVPVLIEKEKQHGILLQSNGKGVGTQRQNKKQAHK